MWWKFYTTVRKHIRTLPLISSSSRLFALFGILFPYHQSADITWQCTWITAPLSDENNFISIFSCNRLDFSSFSHIFWIFPLFSTFCLDISSFCLDFSTFCLNFSSFFTLFLFFLILPGFFLILSGFFLIFPHFAWIFPHFVWIFPLFSIFSGLFCLLLTDFSAYFGQ